MPPKKMCTVEFPVNPLIGTDQPLRRRPTGHCSTEYPADTFGSPILDDENDGPPLCTTEYPTADGDSPSVIEINYTNGDTVNVPEDLFDLGDAVLGAILGQASPLAACANKCSCNPTCGCQKQTNCCQNKCSCNTVDNKKFTTEDDLIGFGATNDPRRYWDKVHDITPEILEDSSKFSAFVKQFARTGD